MKKHLLTLAFAGITAALSAQSNFTISDPSMTNVTGTTVSLWIDQNLQDAHHYTITNTSPNSINVKVRRTIIQLNTPNAVTSFCTDINCYSPAQNMSIQFPVAGSGGHFDLTADYFPDSVAGVGHVRYSVIDQSLPSDSSTFDILYNSTPAGIQVSTIAKASVSNPFPNPASSIFNLNYKLGNSLPENSKVVIYNMLGVRVMETRLAEVEGSVTMDVSNLEEGVYFCALESDGKTLATKRVIVTH